MKPWTKEKEQKPNTTTQSRRFLRKKSLKSKIDLSKSSKCRLFLSRQMHHIKQWGHSHPNSSIPMPPKLSLPASQQLHHCFRHNPMNAKQSKHHRPQIKSRGQWIRRWSTDSPFLLHIQHQSKIKIFHLHIQHQSQNLAVMKSFNHLKQTLSCIN